jgi:hypothetical protein
MSQVAQKPIRPPSNTTMAFKFNKKGRVVETTLKVKDTTLKADIDIVFLAISAFMISLVNILYLTGIIGGI